VKGVVELSEIKSKKNIIAAIVSILIAAILIGVDRFTKWWIVNNIELSSSVSGFRIGSFRVFDITHIHNTGAAFGILQGQRWALVAVTSAFFVVAIVLLIMGRFKSRAMIASITLILAGGIGNLIDRIAYGYVVDFIELKFIRFAIFNFADVCVVVGTFLMAFAVIAEEIREYKAKRACEVDVLEETEETETNSQENQEYD
jgi:signal peptidase II